MYRFALKDLWKQQNSAKAPALREAFIEDKAIRDLQKAMGVVAARKAKADFKSKGKREYVHP